MSALRLALIAIFATVSTAFAQAPPPVPALPDTPRITTYALSASTCNCSVGFALYGDSTDYWDWVEVWVNGVNQPFNDAKGGINWTITSPTGQLATIPRPISDAILTFSAPVTGTVEIVGARRPRRVSQFSESRGVAARDLNQAITDIIAMLRETWDKINDVSGRTILSQPGVTLGGLPQPAQCAGAYLAFDNTGENPICVMPTATGGLPSPAWIITPTTSESFNAGVSFAIAAGYSEVDVTPGVYNFCKTSNVNFEKIPAAIFINGPGNLTIDFHGSTVNLCGQQVTDYAMLFVAQNAIPGTTFTLKNVTFDYQYPPFVQANLTAKTTCTGGTGGSATFSIIGSYLPPWTSVQRMDQYFFNGLYKNYLFNVPTGAPTVVGGSSLASYQLAFNDSVSCAALASSSMFVGGYYGLASNEFAVNTIDLFHMANVVFSNVVVRHSAGNGFTTWGANDVTLINGSGCSPALDPSVTWRSVNGACLIFPAMSGKLTTDPTTVAIASGDDAMYSAPYLMQVISNPSSPYTTMTLTNSSNTQVGDVLQFVDGTGVLQGTFVVQTLTPSGANITVTGFWSGTAPTVTTSYSVYDQSQAPSFCDVEGGKFGWTPNRAIFLNCNTVKVHNAYMANTGAAGFLAQYGGGPGISFNVGLVTSLFDISNNVIVNTNYLNDSTEGAINIWGFGSSYTNTAPAGQYSTVLIKDNTILFAGSGGVYVNAALNVFSQNNTFQNWYTVGAPPTNYQNCSGIVSNPWAYAETYCNDYDVELGGSSFNLRTNNVTYAGVTLLHTSTRYNWSIAYLPPCGATTVGQTALVTNGVLPTSYPQLVGSTAGTAQWPAACNFNTVGYYWYYQ